MYTQIYNSILRPAPSRRLGRQNSVPYREQSYDSGRWFKVLPFPRNLISCQTEPSQVGTWPEHLLWSIVLYAPPPWLWQSFLAPACFQGAQFHSAGSGSYCASPWKSSSSWAGGAGAWDLDLHRGISCEGEHSPPSSSWQPSPCPPMCFCPTLLYHAMWGKLYKEKTDVTKGWEETSIKLEFLHTLLAIRPVSCVGIPL